MRRRAIPPRCPSCGAGLEVVLLRCPACGTEVSGHYDCCPVCQLEGEAAELFQLFLDARGNLKQVQRVLGLSYPTVRQRVEQMFAQLERGPARPDPMVILRKVRSGELDVATAERLLRGEVPGWGGDGSGGDGGGGSET